MTEDTAKLIQEARRWGRSYVERPLGSHPELMLPRLADALESLVAENEKLRQAARLSRSLADEYSAERDALRAQLDTIRAIVNDWHVPTFSERHYGSHTAVVKIENALAAYSPTSEETR